MSGRRRGKRVVLLDRDGTIVVDREYLSDPAGLTFLPGAAEGLRRLQRRGFRLVVITNQSGVGRGLFTASQLQAVNQRLIAMVREVGAELAGIYCCPHRPDEGCSCRKPETGLVQQAAAELGFDPAATIVIGDKASDVELGRRLGAATIRIAAHPPDGDDAGHVGGADHYVVGDLLQAAELIETL